MSPLVDESPGVDQWSEEHWDPPSPPHLIAIHEDDPVDPEGEEDVEEEDLVRPGDALLLSLRVWLCVK